MRRRENLTQNHRRTFLLLAICYSLFAILFAPGCWRPAGFGIGGRYLDAKKEITRRGGNLDLAIFNLEHVVRRDLSYEDSLTLLGRAYYKRQRYKDAFQILKRALAINPKDEIAWTALGLTQLRLGDDQRGLESFKGGITLLSQVAKRGEPYKGVEEWDKNGLVRAALRKAVLYATKGLEDKKKLIRVGEILLTRIDDEEWEAKIEEVQEKRVY